MARNPKAVVKAFAPITEKVGDLSIPPFKLSHHLALEAIGHPLADGKIPESFTDILRAVAIMTLSGPDARAIAADPVAFEKRIGDLAETVSPNDIKPLAKACALQITRAFDTALETKAPEGERRSA